MGPSAAYTKSYLFSGRKFSNKMMSFLKSKLFLTLFSIILMLLSVFSFQTTNTQGINWSFPYFSGAANFDHLFDWQISPSDYTIAAKLTHKQYREYKHRKTADLIPNTVNNYGYVLVALIAQKLLPSFGDVQAVIYLQILVHLGASLFLLLKVFQTNLQRYGFLFLYAANPLIVYFVTFPFYYYWTFLPSVAFVVFWFKPEWRSWSILVLTPLLLFSLLIRPTTLFLCVFFYLVGWLITKPTMDRVRMFVATIVFVSGTILIVSQTGSSPWHTMYVGFGAHSNNQEIHTLRDEEGYNYFQKRTGIIINTNAVAGNYNDPIIRRKYNESLKERYLEILIESPFLVVRNATINIVQGFSVGYIVNHQWLTFASTVLGGCVLFYLIFTRQWIWILGALSYSVGYAWFFPPIPAYHFGVYLLLVTGVVLGSEYLIRNRIALKSILIKTEVNK